MLWIVEVYELMLYNIRKNTLMGTQIKMNSKDTNGLSSVSENEEGITDMWKNFIRSISEDYVFNEPATSRETEQIKEKFNVELPDELLSLLNETDGVNDNYGFRLVWSTSQIIEENSNLRNQEDFKDLYMPFDCLLFISDAGNGDLFAYSILNGSIQNDDIYVWNHENDSRTWVAPSLKKFIEWWSDGTITV